MLPDFKRLTGYLTDLGIESIGHTGKTYLTHLIAVCRLLEEQGCDEAVCRAGLFHSIYGTERFQGFTLPLERRGEVRQLIGERAEHLAWLNCVMDRASFDAAVRDGTGTLRNRIDGTEIPVDEAVLDDLARVHLFDWLEQAPRSKFGWDYRKEAYRRLAERLGTGAVAAFEATYALESASS